jgi:hypothetical protein
MFYFNAIKTHTSFAFTLSYMDRYIPKFPREEQESNFHLRIDTMQICQAGYMPRGERACMIIVGSQRLNTEKKR